jgi:hypothetical protein
VANRRAKQERAANKKKSSKKMKSSEHKGSEQKEERIEEQNKRAANKRRANKRAANRREWQVWDTKSYPAKVHKLLAMFFLQEDLHRSENSHNAEPPAARKWSAEVIRTSSLKTMGAGTQCKARNRSGRTCVAKKSAKLS